MLNHSDWIYRHRSVLNPDASGSYSIGQSHTERVRPKSATTAATNTDVPLFWQRVEKGQEEAQRKTVTKRGV